MNTSEEQTTVTTEHEWFQQGESIFTCWQNKTKQKKQTLKEEQSVPGSKFLGPWPRILY